MRRSHLLPAALLVAAGLTPVRAAELAKLDRTVPDEPKYLTAAPRYALLAFGPEAKTTVWLVQDGDVVHVRASPDGKAPPVWRHHKAEYVSTFALGDIWEDATTCHKNLRLFRTHYQRLSLGVGTRQQLAGWDRAGKLEFAATAKDAPVIHFNGPLTLDLFREQEPLLAGAETEMTAVVGTPGIGPGTFAHFLCRAYPKGAWPTALIEFPPGAAGKSVIAKVRLAEE
jgi:hypothetical protein